jgi:glycosyltransferase Alg8
VKSYMIFFPHKQTWANRGGQRAPHESTVVYQMKSGFAMFQFVTTLLVFVQGVAWLTDRGLPFYGY